MTSKTNAAASGTVSRLSARYDALGLSVLRTELSSGDGMEMIGEETDDNPLAPQAGLLQDASGSHGPMSTPLESPLQSPLLASTPLTERELLSEGSKRLEFKYDYIGRRVSKQVWTHTGGSWTDESTTAFVYDSWNLIEEIATSSQTASINHYTWGLDLSGSLQGAGGVGGLLSVVCAPFTESGLIGDWLLPIGYVPLALSGVEGPAPSTFHYTFDLNGNVSELLDATGSIAAHYEYGPFGEMLVESYSAGLGTAVASFRFSTKYFDAELKTLYYGYRYNDPSNGRWLNRDPIEEEGGLNLYGFVGNDAVNRWDLWGKVPNGTGDYRDTDTETFIIDWEDKEHGFLIRSISLRMNAVDDPEWNMAIDKFVYSAGGTIDGVFENIIHPNLPVQLLLFSKILNELFNGVNTALGNSIGWHVHLTLDVSEKSKLFGYNLPFYSNKTTPYPFAKIENPKHFLGLWLVCSIDELRNNPDFEYEFSIVLANLINQLE